MRERVLFIVAMFDKTAGHVPHDPEARSDEGGGLSDLWRAGQAHSMVFKTWGLLIAVFVSRTFRHVDVCLLDHDATTLLTSLPIHFLTVYCT